MERRRWWRDVTRQTLWVVSWTSSVCWCWRWSDVARAIPPRRVTSQTAPHRASFQDGARRVTGAVDSPTDSASHQLLQKQNHDVNRSKAPILLRKIWTPALSRLTRLLRTFDQLLLSTTTFKLLSCCGSVIQWHSCTHAHTSPAYKTSHVHNTNTNFILEQLRFTDCNVRSFTHLRSWSSVAVPPSSRHFVRIPPSIDPTNVWVAASDVRAVWRHRMIAAGIAQCECWRSPRSRAALRLRGKFQTMWTRAKAGSSRHPNAS